MSRRRGSATALNASDVVAALAMFLIYSHISMCQDLFLLIFPPHFYFYCSAIKMSFQQAQGRLLRKKRAEMRHTAPVEKSTACGFGVCGPIRLVRRTAEGGCPHMGRVLAGCCGFESASAKTHRPPGVLAV